jgi:hypothetical protein
MSMRRVIRVYVWFRKYAAHVRVLIANHWFAFSV